MKTKLSNYLREYLYYGWSLNDRINMKGYKEKRESLVFGNRKYRTKNDRIPL